MNRRDLLKNSLFAGVAAAVGLQTATAEAAPSPEPTPVVGIKPKAPAKKGPSKSKRALTAQVKNIHVFIDFLPDGTLPAVGPLPSWGIPRFGVSKKGLRQYEAWDRTSPFYTIGKEGQNIHEVSKSKTALPYLFEIASNPTLEGHRKTKEQFAVLSAEMAQESFRVALYERVYALVETAQERGHDVNQIYVGVRTPLIGLHAPDQDGTEGYSLFTNLSMSAFMTKYPVGISNPWAESRFLEDELECPKDLNGPTRAAWVGFHAARPLKLIRGA